MSLTDIKLALRKYDFPICAKEALIKTEQILLGRPAPSSKQIAMAMDIIGEFVFRDLRFNMHSGLSPLQELQLIDIICDYLCTCSNDITKNTLFLFLFGGMDCHRRLKILSILASMAVSASCTPVLLAVGVWLQQMGCSSSQSLELVENVIRDHFYLNTSNQATLRSLASTAPQFVCNFITAVTELYMREAKRTKKMPPKNLLEVVTTWVYSNPTLCMSAQLNSPALANGSIPMTAITPLGGLIHLCALAPLYVDDDSDMVDITVPIKKIKLENDEQSQVKSVTNKPLTESELYIKLHLGVLQSLRAVRRTHRSINAVNADYISDLAPLVLEYYTNTVLKKGDQQSNLKLQDCIDRIAQAVQVGFANSCIYGNLNNLFTVLQAMPENRLLRIVIKTLNAM